MRGLFDGEGGRRKAEVGRRKEDGRRNISGGYSAVFCRPSSVVFSLLLLAGCGAINTNILNNKWLRIHKGKNPDVAASRLKMPNLRAPNERVVQLFQKYQMKDWKGMKGMMTKYSDVQWIADRVKDDFDRYVTISAEVWPAKPIFNKDQDRAEVTIEFTIEKILAQNGTLTSVHGRGTFVLADRAGWDILGYVGDPFWGDGTAAKPSAGTGR